MPAPKPEGCGCCGCCCRLLIMLPVSALIMWLSLRPSTPTISMEQLTVFALNRTTTYSNSPNPTNNTIYFDLKLKNNNKDNGLYYDTLNLTFGFTTTSTVLIANVGFPGFYQGHHKRTHRKGTVEARGVDWAAEAERSNGSGVLIRAELATAVRHKILFYKTRRRRLDVGADLRVNGQGALVRSWKEEKKKKGVKFTSGVGTRVGFGLSVVLLLLLHLC